MTHAAASSAPQGALRDRWEGLRTLIRARLLVATLALPVGVLLRPQADDRAVPVLWGAFLAVGTLSAVFELGVRLRRGWPFQLAFQLLCDLALIGALAATTGARESQFVMFFALVVITGGLLGRVPGGTFAAAGACAVYLVLPAGEQALGFRHDPALAAELPRPALNLAFWSMAGVLAGLLGERVRRTREDLDRTTRELDRVRVDNDLILRHLTTGVMMVNGEGVIAYLNPAAEQMLGMRALDLRGRTLEDGLPERLHPLRDLVRGTLAARAPRARAEITLKTPSGRPLPVGISTNPLTHDTESGGVVAVFTDLTEVREMERRARRNETLAEVGALAAGVAHELRNGLKPISGSVECLQRELKLDGENGVLMELIARESARLNRFVSDLLNYSREREMAVTPIGLADELRDVATIVARDPRCGECRVRLDEVPDGLAIAGDREALRQVWLNLAANAFEAMPNGGQLTLRAAELDRGTVAVDFADTGSGIAAGDLPRVGQPFFTTKRGGTGLGLAIAQRIVERHGGTLVLESAPGRGTRARVTFPATVAEMSQAA